MIPSVEMPPPGTSGTTLATTPASSSMIATAIGSIGSIDTKHGEKRRNVVGEYAREYVEVNQALSGYYLFRIPQPPVLSRMPAVATRYGGQLVHQVREVPMFNIFHVNV